MQSICQVRNSFQKTTFPEISPKMAFFGKELPGFNKKTSFSYLQYPFGQSISRPNCHPKRQEFVFSKNQSLGILAHRTSEDWGSTPITSKKARYLGSSSNHSQFRFGDLDHKKGNLFQVLFWLVVSNIFYFHPTWGNDPI